MDNHWDQVVKESPDGEEEPAVSVQVPQVEYTPPIEQLAQIEQLTPEILTKLRKARDGGWGAAEPAALPHESMPLASLDAAHLDLSSVAKIDGLWNKLLNDVRRELTKPPDPLPDDQIVNGVATAFTAIQVQVAMTMPELDEIHIRTALDEVVTIETSPISGATVKAFGQSRITVSSGKVFAYETVRANVTDGGWVRAHDRVEIVEVSGGEVLAFGISRVGHVTGGRVSAFGDTQVNDISGGKVIVRERARVNKVAGGQVCAYDNTWIMDVIFGKVSAFGDAQVTDVSGGQVEAFGSVQITGVTHGKLTVFGSVRVLGVSGGWTQAKGDVTVALEGYATYDEEMGYVTLDGEDIITGTEGEPVPDTVTVTDHGGYLLKPEVP
ncbi:MAG: hypothetical protein H0T78_07115 [Longispora sp.]|nr:hypothetical protein [Longispora sp. (in: high G+C Gram-positive bacteria)]